MSSISNFRVLVETQHGNREVIPVNQLLPTDDAELTPAEPTATEDRIIKLKKDIEIPEYVVFLIPCSVVAKKLIIFVNFDGEIECEIVTNESVIKANRTDNQSKLQIVNIS